MNQLFEINMSGAQKNADLVRAGLHAKSKIVEVFSAVARGESLEKFGNTGDAAIKKIKELAEKAIYNDVAAKAEINEIIRFAIEPKLQKAIQLLSFMGDFKDVGYGQEVRMKTYQHVGVRSNFQASQGDVPFSTVQWREYPIGTQTISGGFAVNYREIASGNLDYVQEGMNQVEIDMVNKSMYYVIVQMVNAIESASGVKYAAATSGITEASVKDIIAKVRPFGRPSLVGDYSVISQLNNFAGFKADPADATKNKLSDAVVEEIRQTGLMSAYNGAPVVEIPNQYNLTALNAAGDNFKKYLPEGLLFVLPQGQTVSPLQVFRRGGLTSMTGNDIISGTEITRFDMEIGAGVAQGMEYQIGLVRDTNFALPTV